MMFHNVTEGKIHTIYQDFYRSVIQDSSHTEKDLCCFLCMPSNTENDLTKPSLTDLGFMIKYIFNRSISNTSVQKQ